MRSVLAVLWVTSTLLACGGARPARSASETQTASSSSPTVASASDTPPAATARRPGPLTRSEADALVAQGLGAWLARVRVAPVFQTGHFVGFRLEAARDLDAWHAAGADVRVGDVIQRVNGIRMERPEQALWAFERLRIAQAIEVQLLRDGSTVTVRSPIVDDVHARTQE
jgi:type II secretory pathway component PulC